MDYIYGKVSWDKFQNVSPFENQTIETRTQKYERIIEYIDSIEPCDFVKNLKLLKRIGSDSKSAEVFLIEYDNNSRSNTSIALNNSRSNTSIALKVLPIINSNSYDKNENELRIALSASNLVLERSSIYFPLVYMFDECFDTVFYNDEYNEKSQIYQKIDKYKSHILMSELADEDLYTYLVKNHSTLSTEDWIELINHCLKAISDLHNKLNVIHNDLHLRNFLVIKYENRIIPLIHDFGSSEFVSEDEIELYEYNKLDINFFLNNLLEFLTLNKVCLNDVEKYITLKLK
jgi:hypothetical protein